MTGGSERLVVQRRPPLKEKVATGGTGHDAQEEAHRVGHGNEHEQVRQSVVKEKDDRSQHVPRQRERPR